MARGAATWDATKMSTLKISAEIMARYAATWDVPSRSTLEESAVCIAKQINELALTHANWRLVHRACG